MQARENFYLEETAKAPGKDTFRQLAFFYKNNKDRASSAIEKTAMIELAQKYYLKALEYDPQNVDILIEYSDLFILMPEQYGDEIENLFKQIMKIDPGNRKALNDFEQYYLTRPGLTEQQVRQGIKLYKKYFDLKGGSLDVWYGIALGYESIGEKKHAIDLMHKGLQKAQSIENKNNPYWNKKMTISAIQEYLGRIYMQQGKMEKAKKLLTDSVAQLEQTENHKKYYWGCPYHALGEFYGQVGNSTKKAEVDIKAAETEPDSQYAQIRAAMASYAVADYATGLQYINRAIALNPSPLLTTTKGLFLLANKKYEKAKTHFYSAQKESVQDPSAKIGLAHLAIKYKNYKKALTLLKEANNPDENVLNRLNSYYGSERTYSAIKPVLAKLYYLGLGWVYGNQNEQEEALEFYKRALRIDPKDILCLLGKGNALLGLKDMESAEVVFQRVLKLQPGNPYALAELALIRYNEGQDADAEILFKQAMEKNPDQYTCPYEGLGLIYLRQGKVAKAKNLFQKAIEINPEIEYKKFNSLAKIYIQEKQYQKAEKLLKKSIKNYPYDPEAKKLLKKVKEKLSDESALNS